jgi:DNA polymerase V
MSFTSPAFDYTGTPLTLASLCRLDGKFRAIETSSGFAVIDITRQAQSGDTVVLAFCGCIQFASVDGLSLITPDGEVIEGDALDDVKVMGVVIFLIKEINKDDSEKLPII